MRLWALLATMAALVLLAGCNQTSSPAERQEEDVGVEEPDKNEKQAAAPAPDIPDYDITLEQQCNQGNIPSTCYSVTTSAASEEDLSLVTQDLAAGDPQSLAVVVSFYPPRQTADISGTGFFFRDEEAARTWLSAMYPQGEDIDAEVRNAMQNDGLYVISIADEVRELTQEMTGY